MNETSKWPEIWPIVPALALTFGLGCGHSSRKVETIANKTTVVKASTSTDSSASGTLDAGSDSLPFCAPDAANTGNGFGEQRNPATDEAEKCKFATDPDPGGDEASPQTATAKSTQTATETATLASTSTSTPTITSTATVASTDSLSTPPTPDVGTDDRWTDPDDSSKTFRYCTSDASDADANGVKDGWGWEFDPELGKDSSCKVRS